MDTRQPFDYALDQVAYCAEFNDDASVFAVGTGKGFRLHETKSGKLIYEKDLEGSIIFASVLASSRYVALIGGGPAAVFAPNKFVLWEHSTGVPPFKIEYNTILIRACLTQTHYCVVFEHGVVLYKLQPEAESNNSKSRIGVYETAPNKHGLCCLGKKKLVIPGRSKGQVQIVDLSTRRISILPAHEAQLRMFAVNHDESVLATAGEKGTLIKLWSTEQEASITQFRRGIEPAKIFSIAFSPSGEQMAVTSDKSTIHIFDMPWRQEAPVEQAPAKNPPRASKRVSYTSNASAARDIPSPMSSSPRSRMYGASPPVPSKYGASPSSGGKYKLGTSPSDRTSITPSDASAGVQYAGATQDWLDMPTQARPSSRRSISTTSGYTDTPMDSETQIKRTSQKYGNLANFPLAPRFLKDTYSTMSCRFEMGDEPSQRRRDPGKGKEILGDDDDTASVATVRTTGTVRREKDNPWWVEGRPPKGKVAWIDETSLVVVGAGRDARWERFVLGVDRNRQRGIERRGWKRYLEDEGVDE